MHLDDFDYHLPPQLIAQQPLAERSASRMLVLDRAARVIHDRKFADLPGFLNRGDLLVLNITRVFPARLLGRRRGARSQPVGRGNPAAGEYLTGEVELLLTRRESGDVWQGLVHPGRKIGVGEVLVFGEGELEAEVLARGERGLRRVRLVPRSSGHAPPHDAQASGAGAKAGAATGPAVDRAIERAIDRLGRVPLPPYIHRSDLPGDRESYQTVYAKVRGAVAAPTAGLHFTPQVLSDIAARGVETAEITLHVGPGTFRPVQTEHVEQHRMEPEAFAIGDDAARSIDRALAEGRRVVAVGTTCVRTLEHAVRAHAERAGQAGAPQVEPGQGETSLYIYPGFEFRAVGALLTNFHLPRSTLLMLVAAFAGREFVLRAYRHAVDEGYRFYSYGDCMLIL